MIQKKNRWAWAIVVCFVVGVFGGSARGWDLTKKIIIPSDVSGHYPQDHSQPGTGMSPDPASNNHPGNNPHNLTCVNRYGHIVGPKCYTCDRWGGGSCEMACAGGLWCDDSNSTCLVYGSCAM